MAGGREAPQGGAVIRLHQARPCPICGKDSARVYYPFCSRRCGDIDLNRWLSGAYAIPAVEDDGNAGGSDDGTS